MNTPQQIFNPQFAALQNQMGQLQSVYNQISTQQSQQSNKLYSQIPFVDGIAGAKAYLNNMAPNSSAAVFDRAEAVFFFLTTDANGVAEPIKIGKFTIEEAPEPESNIVTKQDFDAFKNEMRSMISGMQKPKRDFNDSANKQIQGGNK